MPTLTFERQKMSVEIWEKLKSHIMKQREKRKQEQEQDAEQERHRREQEQKRKRDAITLEDIKDQLGKLETNLSELQQKKSDLFLQLKKVLNEDEMRKKQAETHALAARAAIYQHKAQTNNNPQISQIMLNQSANSRMLPTSQASQLQSQQLSAIQQQQLMSKHSPVTSLSNHPNYMNTVINSQSLAPAHQPSQQQQQQQQQAQQLTNKQSLSVNRKRPLDRSSPQMTGPSSMPQQYNGILPNYKSPLGSYTPATAVSRIATTSQQAFFPQNSRPMSIPVTQQSISSGQLSFDSKAHPYLALAGGLPSDSSLTPEQHANLLNSAAAAHISQQQINQLQQELYYQHLIKNASIPANLQSPSLMSMQNAPMKAGITSGYPIVQRPGSNSNPPSTSANTANANNVARFTGRYMY